MYRLYQFQISPFCDKIRRVMNLKRVPYETQEVGLLEAQLGYRRTNPAGKVPALLEEGSGRVISDSTEIAYYLEERYPDPPLFPKNPRERAMVQVLEDWADESLYFYELRLRFGFAHNRQGPIARLLSKDPAFLRVLGPFVIPRVIQGQLSQQGIGRKSDAQVLAEVRRHMDTVCDLLDGRRYLVGETLTLADIAVFAQLFCIRDSAEGAAELAARPGLSAYVERVDAETRAA
jgi:glutathione S-transferase